MRTLAVAIITTILLAACDRQPETAVVEAVAANAAQKTHQQEIFDWRAERVQRLQKPDGWLSLVGMHWLDKGSTRVGTGATNGTRLTVGPEKLGLVTVGKDRKITFTPESGVEVTIDGLPAVGSAELVPDSAGTATVVGFNKGDTSFIVIDRGGRFALRVRNANAITRVGFTGIDYFDIDSGFRFKAKFTAHEPGKKIEIVNILSMIEPMDNPGTVTFEKDGKSYTLEAVDEGDHRLFLIYADRTSGHESYPAARFLYAEYPDEAGNTFVDFNKGYNPPCAFTAFSTCPMPPAGNRLDLAITAGEKKPRKAGAGT